MRRISTLAAAAVLICISFQGAQAGFPANLRNVIERIQFDGPTLAPMAYTQFCLRYTQDCRSRMTFRGGPTKLTTQRWAELREVNQTVNGSIIPEQNDQGL